jgi:hypothetical protein
LKPIPIDASRALRRLACAENVPIQTQNIATAIKFVNHIHVVTNWPTVNLKPIPIDACRALRTPANAENAPIQTRKIATGVKVANCFNAKPEVVVLQPKNQNALDVVQIHLVATVRHVHINLVVELGIVENNEDFANEVAML